MVKDALMELAKRSFWLITVILVLSVPMMLLFGPVIEQDSRAEVMSVATVGWVAISSLVAFTLVVVGIIVFWVFPALLQLGEAIWKARQDAANDMFP